MQTYARGFKSPDEVRPFKAHGHLDVVKLADKTTIGQGVFEPGWQWSKDVKPIAGTASCQSAHTGFCVSGSMTLKMDSGEQFTIHPGEAFHIPAGHDAWTEGNLPCVLIDWTGFDTYAKRS